MGFKTEPGRELKLLAAMPGTTRELIRRTGLPRSWVQGALRQLTIEGSVRRETRWFGSLSYTYVYRRAFEPKT